MDKYTKIKKLGEGSFGETWKAVLTGTPTIVAIKIIKNNIRTKSEKFFKDFEFRNEFQALRLVMSLCNNRTPCLHSAFEQGNNFYIVMDFIDGWNVWDAMCGDITAMSTKRIPLSLRRTTYHRIMSDLVTGLYSIHNLGVTHQDIKGENLMWDEKTLGFKFIDFGLACILAHGIDTEYGKMYAENNKSFPCGTRGNSLNTSPEMLDPKTHHQIQNIDPSITFPEEWLRAKDIWGIGAVLLTWFSIPDYQLHIGNDEIQALWYAHGFGEDPDGYSTVFQDIKTFDENIYTVLMICFQRDPYVRIKKFDEMAQALFNGYQQPSVIPDWDNVAITDKAIQRLHDWTLETMPDAFEAVEEFKEERKMYIPTPFTETDDV